MKFESPPAVAPVCIPSSFVLSCAEMNPAVVGVALPVAPTCVIGVALASTACNCAKLAPFNCPSVTEWGLFKLRVCVSSVVRVDVMSAAVASIRLFAALIAAVLAVVSFVIAWVLAVVSADIACLLASDSAFRSSRDGK